MDKIPSNTKKATKNGIEIQNHLNRIYEEMLSETFRAEFELLKEKTQAQPMSCMACGCENTEIIWSDNYSGFRGMCIRCMCNWPES